MGSAEGLGPWETTLISANMGADRPRSIFFRDGLDAELRRHAGIPRTGDEAWKFTTGKLRRTVAWLLYIAIVPRSAPSPAKSNKNPVYI